MDVGVKTLRAQHDAIERGRIEARGERGLRFFPAEGTRPRARDRDANAAPRFRNEHADDRETRRLLPELRVARRFRNREAYGGDDLPRLERGLEKTFEERVCL